jgi:KDO2-lipid IV(A) lauroyltransferase
MRETKLAGIETPTATCHLSVAMDTSESIARRASGYCQAAALGGGVRFLRQLGPVQASDLGGWLARMAGPSLSVSAIANTNLQHAFPEFDAGQRDGIIRAVWDNLGRTVAELPHLATLTRTAAGPGWELQGEEHVDALRGPNKPALFFSGHFGNWEMVLPIAAQLGLPVAGFYRASSNLRVNAIVQTMRLAALGPAVSMFAKGSAGARAALLHLQGGGSLGMLTDQKMNDGIAVPFMGRDAMTAPALAQLALRFDAPIIPVRIVRLGPARVRMVCEAPLATNRSGDRKADVFALTLAMNQTLERWIRADPASWLWLHRRWPKVPG